MRALAGGVVMVTSWIDGRPWGLTVTSCCSLSAAPPKVLLSLGHGCASRGALLSRQPFGINILHADQRPIAELGAELGVPKFIEPHTDGAASRRARSPVVAGALTHLDCSVDAWWDVADHTIFVGDVHAIGNWHMQHGRGPEPLLYLDRSYRRVGHEEEAD